VVIAPNTTAGPYSCATRSTWSCTASGGASCGYDFPGYPNSCDRVRWGRLTCY
jgi:hypothetical protein